MTTGLAVGDVLDAVRCARAALGSLPAAAAATASRDEWSAVLTGLQSVVDEATALQDRALVALATTEGAWAEDGTLTEVRTAPGQVALDAPGIVAGALTMTTVAAERRLQRALRLTADDERRAGGPTGLLGLHTAMRTGRLDAHRAGVVADELVECDPEVSASVVAAVDPWFDHDDGPRLRRRVRHLLARVCPDALRRRAERARGESSLRRWVDEPGVDTWLGTFPADEARDAWAAVDALAQTYLTQGSCTDVGRARARALTDLVTSRATVTTTVVHHAAHPTTGALLDPDGSLATAAYRPGDGLAALVRARDGGCRFPGCSVAGRWCDLDHVVPWPAGRTAAENLACLCRRHHRTKQRPGWSVRLHPDASMTWTDPTGRVRTTFPVDHLRPEGCHSPVEFALEHLGGRPGPAPPVRVDHHRAPRGRAIVRLDLPPGHHRRRRRRRPGPHDIPPF